MDDQPRDFGKVYNWTVEAFQPPTQGKNFQSGETEYTYWVKFKEFTENVMVVKRSQAIQVGGNVVGKIEQKESKKGNTFYRLYAAKQGETPEGGVNTTVPPQPATQAPSNLPAAPVATKEMPASVVVPPARETDNLSRRMWAFEQAVMVLSAGHCNYDDMVAVATDFYNGLDKITVVEGTPFGEAQVISMDKAPATLQSIIGATDTSGDKPAQQMLNGQMTSDTEDDGTVE